MARRYKSETEVREVMDGLARSFPTYGDVAKLVRALNELNDTSDVIHPNRIHTLLNGDPTSAINEKALKLIEEALANLQCNVEANQNFQQKLARDLPPDSLSLTDEINRIASENGLPPYVVSYFTNLNVPAASTPKSINEPDWSWQEYAIERTFNGLQASDKSRVGLIIPTGGGKTRIANTVALKWLTISEQNKVCWITNRVLLEGQAEESFFELMRAGFDPQEWGSIRDRMCFKQILGMREAGLPPETNLFIIDEAHHAAAQSYVNIIGSTNARGLFLTATPNRLDELPIGIEDVAYEITYQELIDKNCLVKPVFEDAYKVQGASLFRDEGICLEFARHVLQRKETDLRKVLICVSKQEYAETLYRALIEAWAELREPYLEYADIGFVHSDKNSDNIAGSRATAPTFLRNFKSKNEGILVATSQLIGEGYDDPAIDSVFVTYASTSISHLMQVAGRALRRSEGKTEAKIIQVQTTKLEYYFSQKWLYQDISDNLRPVIQDIVFTDKLDLMQQVEKVLEDHNVRPNDRSAVFDQIQNSYEFEKGRLFLAGMPYFSHPDAFSDEAVWRAGFFEGETDRQFRKLYNDISHMDEIRVPEEYLDRHSIPHIALDSYYLDLIQSMNGAKSEKRDNPDRYRPYKANLGTTFLINIKITKDYVANAASDFLSDCLNRDEMEPAMQEPDFFALVKIRLPLGMFECFSLTEEEFLWTCKYIDEARRNMEGSGYIDGWQAVARFRLEQGRVPLRQRLYRQIDQILDKGHFAQQVWAKSKNTN